MEDKTPKLTKHEARSIYEYVSELEDYVENCDGEEDLRTIARSYNRGGKLRRGIRKLAEA